MSLTQEQLRQLRAARREEWRDVLVAHGLALLWTALGLLGVCYRSPVFVLWHIYWFISQVFASTVFACVVIACMFLLPIWLLRAIGGFRHGGTRQLQQAGFRVEASASVWRRLGNSMRSAALPGFWLDRLNRRGKLGFQVRAEPLFLPKPFLSFLVISMLISMHHFAFLTAIEATLCGRVPWYARLPSWGNAECEFGFRVPRAPTHVQSDLFPPPPWCG